jgi:hypothetical protein
MVLALAEGIKQLTCLGAAVLTGTAISAEVEDQTADLLLLTPLSARQIVVAKLGAATRLLRAPLAAVMIIRLLVLLTNPGLMASLFWFSEAMVFPLPTLPFPASPAINQAAWALSRSGYRLLETSLWRLDNLRYQAVWPLWATYYVLQPALDAVLFAAVGLFASAQRRTRSGGQIAAVSLAAGLWLAGYLAERVAVDGLSLIWAAALGYYPLLIWSPEWFVGYLPISPPGLIEMVWTVGLPVMPVGYLESGWLPVVMALLTVGSKVGLLWWLLNTTTQRTRRLLDTRT